MENLTVQIIHRVLELQEIPIEQEIFHCAKRCLLDYCGVVLAGAELEKKKNIGVLHMLAESGTKGSITLFGMRQKADVYTAALINGMNAHAIELDDGHRFGMMHMGASIISAVLAVAEERKLCGEKILRAIICGYDIAIALARHMQPGHKLKGYHATGTCCTVGAAMGIALLLDYSAEQVQGALSAAATSAAGVLEVIYDASQLKPYNVGRAAMDAVAAAFVGGAGFAGPDDVIGGKRGFYAVMATEEDYCRVIQTQLFEKNKYAITEIYTKPYAACRHCHPAIEGSLNLREQLLEQHHIISSDNVESVTVYTYKLAIGGHDHICVPNVSSAKMSIPYSVTVALLLGLGGMSAYAPERISETSIDRFMGKIKVVLSQELDALAPQKRAAIVEIKLKDGKVYSNRVDYPRGEPENMMQDSELEDKLNELATINGKTQEEMESLKKIIWNYAEDADKLYRFLL